MKVNIMSKNNTATIETNVVISAQVTQFVEQYKMCVKKTAKSILELADVVLSAKESLSDKNYTQFRNQIGADKSKDSYIKKLLCIAKNSARLNSISANLPPTYTTLYTLSQLSNDKFNQVCSENIITPNMTALALTSYLEKKTSKNVPDIVLSFKNLNDNVKQVAFAEIKSICIKFNIDLKSNIQLPTAKIIEKLSDLNVLQIANLELDSELETA